MDDPLPRAAEGTGESDVSNLHSAARHVSWKDKAPPIPLENFAYKPVSRTHAVVQRIVDKVVQDAVMEMCEEA